MPLTFFKHNVSPTAYPIRDCFTGQWAVVSSCPLVAFWAGWLNAIKVKYHPIQKTKGVLQESYKLHILVQPPRYYCV